MVRPSFFFCFSVRMHPKLIGSLKLRDHLAMAIKDPSESILEHCSYCKCCRACSIDSRLQKEFSRSDFKTIN